jgi:hypothetical protein
VGGDLSNVRRGSRSMNEGELCSVDTYETVSIDFLWAVDLEGLTEEQREPVVSFYSFLYFIRV